ncbi:MAG: LysR family transcriptional regulator [Pseudomonadota bacterium]
MSRLEEIETFVAIVDAGTLTEAAHRSGLALSAVSRRLKDLETRMGSALIHRTTRTMALTDEGQTFYQRCKQILSDLEEAETSLKDSGGQITGRIRVAAPLTFSVRHLAPILLDFKTKNPEVQIELDLSDRRVDLIEEGFDLAIRIGRLTDSSMIAKRLTKIRHLPTVSPMLLDRIGRPETPEDLKRFPTLSYRHRGPKVTWDFIRPEGSAGSVEMHSAMTCNNGDVLSAAAEQGLGIAVEPTFICTDAILSGKLEPLFVDHIWSDNAAYVVFPESRALPKRVRALIDYLADRFSPDPWWDKELMKYYPIV